MDVFIVVRRLRYYYYYYCIIMCVHNNTMYYIPVGFIKPSRRSGAATKKRAYTVVAFTTHQNLPRFIKYTHKFKCVCVYARQCVLVYTIILISLKYYNKHDSRQPPRHRRSRVYIALSSPPPPVFSQTIRLMCVRVMYITTLLFFRFRSLLCNKLISSTSRCLSA